MLHGAESLFDYTKKQLTSLIFRYEHKTSPEHFTRQCILDFRNTALIILNMIKKSTKAEVMDFFYRFDREIDVPSRQALSQAREKISYLAFKDFFEKSCEIAVNGEGARLFVGYRLFAIDGTSFMVGELNKLSEYFGESTSVKDKAMCRISGIVDVLNDCIINALVSPFAVGERSLAVEQIKALKSASNALYLLDRGYWSKELTAQIIENGQKFLMRLPSNITKTVVTDVTDKSGATHDLRRFSFTLPSGETEILLTNITADEMSDAELAGLYTKRWGIETKYLELKDRLQINKLSGESVNIVLQDIYSTLYMSNLVAFICFKSDESIKEKTNDKNNKYEQKTNKTTCISTLRNRFIDICLMLNASERSLALRRLYDDISKDVVYTNKSKPRPRDKNKIKQARRNKRRNVL